MRVVLVLYLCWPADPVQQGGEGTQPELADTIRGDITYNTIGLIKTSCSELSRVTGVRRHVPLAIRLQ